MISGTKSPIVLKKNLIANPSTVKKFWKPIWNHESTDFHNKEIPKVGSNYTCLALILMDFIF